MSLVGKRIEEFFHDERGQLSFGRLATAFCLFAVIVGFVVGIFKNELADYCKKFIDSMLLAGVGFFNGSKLQQAISSFGSPTPPGPEAPPPPPSA